MEKFLLLFAGIIIGVLVEHLIFKKDCNPADEQLKQEISDKLDRVISDIKTTI